MHPGIPAIGRQLPDESAAKAVFSALSVSRSELDKNQDAVVVVHDATQALLYVNDRAASLFRYGREELLALETGDFLTIRTGAEEDGNVRTRTGFGRERGRRKGGEIVDLALCRISVSYHGEPAWLIIARENTDAVQSAEDHARLASAVEAAADSIVITDTRGMVIYVNPAFSATSGYAREEIQGRDVHILDSGRHPAEFYEAMRERLRREGSWSGRMVHRKKDGSLAEEDCVYSAVRDASGGIISHVSIRRDVSEKVRLQSIAQAINSTNNLCYIFSGVRHELANPINAIRSLLSSLKNELDRIDRKAMESYVDLFLEETARMQDLLGSLRTFSPYEKPDLRPVALRPFLEQFEALMRSDMERKGITLDFQPARTGLACMTDPRALRQILLNVVANAADALKDRERRIIRVRALQKKGFVRIRVVDSGCGIPGNMKTHLFEPFHTTKPGGTGLGLAIVKKMLEMMNGRIEIRTRPDVGTSVDLVLPPE